MASSDGHPQGIDASSEVHEMPVEAHELPSDWLRLRVSTLSGESLGVLTVRSSMTGGELLERVKQLQPFYPDCILRLVIGECFLDNSRSMAEHGIQDESECKCLWRRLSEKEKFEVIRKVDETSESINADEHEIWESLQSLTFGSAFKNDSLAHVGLPSNLSSLTLGNDDSLEKVILPSTLRHLTLHFDFDQSMEKVSLPNGLEHLTFRGCFNQSLENVNLPSGLQHLELGGCFNQDLENVNLPSGLRHLTVGGCFDQSLDKVKLPGGLQHLTLGGCFNHSLEKVHMPCGLRKLTLGRRFTSSLDKVKLPSGILITKV